MHQVYVNKYLQNLNFTISMYLCWSEQICNRISQMHMTEKDKAQMHLKSYFTKKGQTTILSSLQFTLLASLNLNFKICRLANKDCSHFIVMPHSPG